MSKSRNAIDLTHQQNTLEKLQGERLYEKVNLLAYWDILPQGDFLNSSTPSLNNWLSFLSNYKFKPVSEYYLAAIYMCVADINNESLPEEGFLLLTDSDQCHDKKIRKKRLSFLDKIKKDFFLENNGDSLEVKLMSGRDITSEVNELSRDKVKVKKFLEHRYVPNYLNKHLKKIASENKGLVIFLSNSSIDYKSPTIAFCIESNAVSLPSVAKMADIIVDDEVDVFNSTLSLILEHCSLSSLRRSLEESISTREIEVVPSLSKENWIEYPLMKSLKAHIKKAVSKNLCDEPLLCDPIDLEYQTLFRLTSFDLEEVFHKGDELKSIVEMHTKQIGWRGLVTIDSETVSRFKPKLDFVDNIIREQKKVIAERLKNSSLPLERILKPSGIFAEDGWVIVKSKDGYRLEHPVRDSIRIYFKEVDKEVAQAFHNDLHYIHTPRIWKAYGFFLEGSDIPFSVLAIEPVDRTYKKNTLLLFGYDPRHCIEFTRLYSWPGVPKNVSSAIFGAMFSHLRTNEPRLEAAISAFMPSYASGLSMLTGGFNFPVLSKKGVHYFSPKNINGDLAMEHITNRRKSSKIVSSSSKLPLLPTIELIAPIKHSRFKPFLQIGTHMIEV